MTRLRRIGLNALFLDPGVSGGSETYLRALVPAMLQARPDLRFELATTRRGAAALAAEPCDLRATPRQFRMAERSNVTRRPRDITRWAAFRVWHRPDVAIADPTPSTNGVFVVADRRA